MNGNSKVSPTDRLTWVGARDTCMSKNDKNDDYNGNDDYDDTTLLTGVGLEKALINHGDGRVGATT